MRLFGLLAAVLWGASLFTQPFQVCALDGTHSRGADGLAILLVGWEGTSSGVLAWWANPLWLVAEIQLIGRKRPTRWLSAIAFLLAASSLLTTQYQSTSGDEMICSRDHGYWLWMVAIALPFAASMLFATPRPRRHRGLRA